MSDTPRTNAAIATKGPYKKEYFEKNMPVRFLAVCKLCEQLERELTAAQAELSRFEQAALPTEPERLTLTRKLVSGGVATETVVAAHHYDALHIRLARYEAAERELPEEPEIMTVDVMDEVSGIESAQPFIHACDHEKLRDAFIAQKVRANENERDAKSWRDFIKQVKAAQASEETSVIDAAIKEQA